MKHTWIGLGLLSVALSGCGYPVRREKLVDKFVLFAADDPQDLSICREIGSGSCVGGIEGTIAAVGMNKHYISALQHPHNNPAILNYWYIDLTVADSEFKGVTGPLTKEAFETATQTSDIPLLTMPIDKTYCLQRKYRLSNYLF
ncbi:hypothetical protein [Asticcacaulis taihuensis]|uniref:hypothetical protein n=1 Tax=Asticcacaulis taihuensis TaxID=260084 RepID=UPI0026F336D0|nr:hypothetical protein [Asticcacaulis taihuensis]